MRQLSLQRLPYTTDVDPHDVGVHVRQRLHHQLVQPICSEGLLSSIGSTLLLRLAVPRKGACPGSLFGGGTSVEVFSDQQTLVSRGVVRQGIRKPL